MKPLILALFLFLSFQSNNSYGSICNTLLHKIMGDKKSKSSPAYQNEISQSFLTTWESSQLHIDKKWQSKIKKKTLQINELINEAQSPKPLKKKIQARDHKALELYIKSMQKILPSIVKMNTLIENSSESQKKFRKKGLTLSWLFLTHHLTLLFESQKPNLIQWNNIQLILTEIESFNINDPDYFFYKIYRAIKSHYSLEEFSNCS